MKFVYFDAFSGCSGDMILGALLDLGADRSAFLGAVTSLGLPVEVTIQETRRGSLRGLKADVKVTRKDNVSRKWADIQDIISRASLSKAVKERALAVFRRLFEAEARVHGHAWEETHLHEAGADDALVDIVGFSVLTELLDISEFYASPLNIGGGWIKAAHGVLPVPAPAVSELLKGVPTYSAHVQKELVTPTGAAILTTAVKAFSALPELCYDRVGWGAGERDIPELPNLLRVFYGDCETLKPDKQVFQIEVNIDDSTPQVLACFQDRALQEGALDVSLTPVMMKKNRLASKLSILVEEGALESIIRLVFRETSSIGVRYYPVKRRVLARRFESVSVLGEKVRIKLAELEGETVNIQPEFDDCLRAADKTGRPVKEVLALALQAYAEGNSEHEER
ncbi:MAG: nickel pincer cofactor biosynthesis protein LarC [Candidatus Aminicenantaceae bacterium]